MTSRARGFTLIELMVALVLMAGIASILYGSLALAGRSWDGGEAKADQVSDMRSALTYLRTQLSEQYPQRMWKTPEVQLLFAGEHDEMRYAAVLPERVAGGGVYYFRLAVRRNGDKSQLVQERLIPDPSALQEPEFRDAERSVLADDVADLKVSYFGRDANAAELDAPTWRDRWDDRQRLPLLVRVDVKPVKGAPWPSLLVEPRRAPEAGCPVWDAAQSRCVRAGGR
jgi:general secretion pathway protein J